MIRSSSCQPWQPDSPAKPAGDHDGRAVVTPLTGTRSVPRAGSRTSDRFYLGRAQVHGGMRLCTSSCRTCCPTNDASACRNVLHNDCRFGAASSCPRTTIRGDCVEVAASRTEEGDGDYLSNDCSDGKSIRQREKVLTLCCCTADHSQWVETHLRQALLSVGGYHDALT